MFNYNKMFNFKVLKILKCAKEPGHAQDPSEENKDIHKVV